MISDANPSKFSFNKIKGYKKIQKRKWSKQETEKLFLYVDRWGCKWKKISEHMNQRSTKQCMQKYYNMINEDIKGNWNEEEDLILIKWGERHGNKKWDQCVKILKERNEKECQERWINILNPELIKGKWQVEEQIKLFAYLVIFGCSWGKVSNHLKTRSEQVIKTFFYSCLRIIRTNEFYKIFKMLFEIQMEENVNKNNHETFPFHLIRMQFLKLNVFNQLIVRMILETDQENLDFIQIVLDIIFKNKITFVCLITNKKFENLKKQLFQLTNENIHEGSIDEIERIIKEKRTTDIKIEPKNLGHKSELNLKKLDLSDKFESSQVFKKIENSMNESIKFDRNIHSYFKHLEFLKNNTSYYKKKYQNYLKKLKNLNFLNSKLCKDE